MQTEKSVSMSRTQKVYFAKCEVYFSYYDNGLGYCDNFLKSKVKVYNSIPVKL